MVLRIEKVVAQSHVGLVFVQLEVQWLSLVNVTGSHFTNHSFVIGSGDGVDEAIDDAEARAAAMLLQRPSSG